ncbi:MAG: MarR family transcriptional regulator [Desulfobacter sp.]|nr:MAG: MarR family transcriptional regulator [Desulfobacter sp.]
MSKSDETFNVNDSFPMMMCTCVKYMKESLNKRFRDAGFNVTNEQWIILVHLAQEDGISQQKLADRYDRSKVSALNLIQKLETGGYVIRRVDPDDRRANLVYLTDNGRLLLNKLIPLAKENITYMSREISMENMAVLKHIVKKITENIKT